MSTLVGVYENGKVFHSAACHNLLLRVTIIQTADEADKQ